MWTISPDYKRDNFDIDYAAKFARCRAYFLNVKRIRSLAAALRQPGSPG